MYKSERNGFCPQLVTLVVTSKSRYLHTFSKQPVNKVCSSFFFFFPQKLLSLIYSPSHPTHFLGVVVLTKQTPACWLPPLTAGPYATGPFWAVLLPGWLPLPTLLLVADAEPIPAARVSASQHRLQDTSRMVIASPPPPPPHPDLLTGSFSVSELAAPAAFAGGMERARLPKGEGAVTAFLVLTIFFLLFWQTLVGFLCLISCYLQVETIFLPLF